MLRERRGELLREMLALSAIEDWCEADQGSVLVLLLNEYAEADQAVGAAMERWAEGQVITDCEEIADRLHHSLDALEDFLDGEYHLLDPDGAAVDTWDSYLRTIVNPMSRRFAEVLYDAGKLPNVLPKKGM